MKTRQILDNAEVNSSAYELPEPARALPIALLQAREAVMANFRPLLDRYGISEQQWRVIRMLKEFGEMDASELAAQAVLFNSSLTRMIRLLEQRQLIKRRKDKNDGRRTLITLGARGKTLIDKMTPDSQTIYRQLEKRIDPKTMCALLDLLATITERAAPPVEEKN